MPVPQPGKRARPPPRRRGLGDYLVSTNESLSSVVAELCDLVMTNLTSKVTLGVHFPCSARSQDRDTERVNFQNPLSDWAPAQAESATARMSRVDRVCTTLPATWGCCSTRPAVCIFGWRHHSPASAACSLPETCLCPTALNLGAIAATETCTVFQERARQRHQGVDLQGTSANRLDPCHVNLVPFDFCRLVAAHRLTVSGYRQIQHGYPTASPALHHLQPGLQLLGWVALTCGVRPTH